MTRRTIKPNRIPMTKQILFARAILYGGFKYNEPARVRWGQELFFKAIQDYEQTRETPEQPELPFDADLTPSDRRKD